MKKSKNENDTKTSLRKRRFSGNSSHLIILFFLSFVIYANTLTHKYTQDDAIVIYDNMFTTQGISGIPGLLKYDTFYGFFKEKGKAKLVSGGRYRPFTPIMFAVERQIFGNNPFWGHLFNVLWFSLLVIVLYKVLEKLFLQNKEDKAKSNLIFLACLIFAVHPIHTEAVANIKGRDEIMTLLGSLLTLYYLLKSYDNYHLKYVIYAFLAGFIALMSKENAITFMAVIPLSFVFFRNSNWVNAFKKTMPFIASTILFMIIRTSVLGFDFGDKSMELMNNPFIKIVGNKYVPFSFVEWFSTITVIMLKYIQLLVVPHPLTHDYYPRHIDIMTFSNWQVWIGLLTYAGLIYVMIKKWGTDKLVAWSIFFFIATISIVSNIVFPIGTNMSERFLFMPSIAFVLVLAYYVMKLPTKTAQYVSLAIILLFSAKTFTRNMVWQDDFTLFTTDVKTSKRSAKVLNAAGGALSTEAAEEKNETKKKKMLQQSISYLNEAIKIHPNYKNAHLIRANDHFYLGNLDQAIKGYQQTLSIAPGFTDANKNLAIAYRDRARLYGEKENNLAKAIELLKKSIDLNNKDTETIRLLAISNGMSGNHELAIKYFTEITQLEPKNASGFANLSSALRQAGKIEEATVANNKALAIDPQVYEKMRK